MAKMITLQAWLELVYGEQPPHMNTVRRWVRDNKIQPPPEKHGRAYYVSPDARYDAGVDLSLLERIGKAA